MATVAASPQLVDLCDLRFDDRFVRELPGDPVARNVPRHVPGVCYSLVAPTPVASPALLAWSDAVGQMLGALRPESPTGAAAQVLGGNRLLPGMQPYAARYGGHQFASLVLGLAALSPRIDSALAQIEQLAPEPPPKEGDDTGSAGPGDDVLGEDGSLGR